MWTGPCNCYGYYHCPRVGRQSISGVACIQATALLPSFSRAPHFSLAQPTARYGQMGNRSPLPPAPHVLLSHPAGHVPPTRHSSSGPPRSVAALAQWLLITASSCCPSSSHPRSPTLPRSDLTLSTQSPFLLKMSMLDPSWERNTDFSEHAIL